MQVRFKDTCGIKLKLPHWNRFSPEQRQKLVDLPAQQPMKFRLIASFATVDIREQVKQQQICLLRLILPGNSTTIPVL